MFGRRYRKLAPCADKSELQNFQRKMSALRRILLPKMIFMRPSEAIAIGGNASIVGGPNAT